MFKDVGGCRIHVGITLDSKTVLTDACIMLLWLQVSVPAIKGTYSEGFKVLVTDMLLKDPQARPSAHDLYTLRVPALMLQEEEEEVRDTPPDDTTTK